MAEAQREMRNIPSNTKSTWIFRYVFAAIFLTCVVAVGLFANPQQNESSDSSTKEGETEKKVPENPFPNYHPKSPPLEGGVAWLNSAGPIEMSKLKGKVVLLDFWTYCCINCMHVLPELAKLEEEFPNELVVIGVHSAKFEGEKNSDNIREAIMRYDIKHPVVNDANMTIWRTYGVNSWPTLALIDPDGRFIGRLSGEGHYATFRAAIQRIVDYHRAKGTLDTTPLHFQLESYGAENTPLRFPGKVIGDPKTNRLYIADSSHHRIVVAKLDSGEILHTIGDGVPEFKDGAFDVARFHDPQGMAYSGDILYVADTKNHSVRKLDLQKQTVTTVVGIGTQGYERRRSGPGTTLGVASPWDVLLIDGKLYIAMAGTHQIWVWDVKTGIASPYAGSGRENIVDGTREASQFAQPSGLATDGKSLFVADSEVSAIRKINLKSGSVETVVGQGLFDFGDVDGYGSGVRLQHALGVASRKGKLYVADTYNNKIKVIDPSNRHSTTFVGELRPGATDSPARFDEPGGISLVGDQLYIADTNNHAIRAIDIATKKVRTVVLQGLKAPEPPVVSPSLPGAKIETLAPVSIKSGKKLRLECKVAVPIGHKLNPAAPMTYRVQLEGEDGKLSELKKSRIKPVSDKFSIDLENVNFTGKANLRVSVTLFPCEVGSEGLCRIKTQEWQVSLSVDAVNGTETIKMGL